MGVFVNKINADIIRVQEELKIIKTTGEIETNIFSVSGAGTVTSGKSKNQQTEAEVGLILKSANGHRWKIQVSDTGQLVTTDLGL